MSTDRLLGQGFYLDQDQCNIISSGLNRVTEIIQGGSYHVNNIPRAAMRMGSDDILQIFFAEHLALGIMSFPDAVCADNDESLLPAISNPSITGSNLGSRLC